MEFGISTFGEIVPDHKAGNALNAHKRVQELLEEAKLADEIGLDVFALGEHHRSDYVISAPEMILAAAASITKNIKFISAVTVLSSADPVRVFQNFATLDLISNGRAQIMAGRGSFIESFPLFGYDLSLRGIPSVESVFCSKHRNTVLAVIFGILVRLQIPTTTTYFLASFARIKTLSLFTICLMISTEFVPSVNFL